VHFVPEVEKVVAFPVASLAYGGPLFLLTSLFILTVPSKCGLSHLAVFFYGIYVTWFLGSVYVNEKKRNIW
jgi:hypothetical protein